MCALLLQTLFRVSLFLSLCVRAIPIFRLREALISLISSSCLGLQVTYGSSSHNQHNQHQQAATTTACIPTPPHIFWKYEGRKQESRRDFQTYKRNIFSFKHVTKHVVRILHKRFINFGKFVTLVSLKVPSGYRSFSVVPTSTFGVQYFDKTHTFKCFHFLMQRKCAKVQWNLDIFLWHRGRYVQWTAVLRVVRHVSRFHCILVGTSQKEKKNPCVGVAVVRRGKSRERGRGRVKREGRRNLSKIDAGGRESHQQLWQVQENLDILWVQLNPLTKCNLSFARCVSLQRQVFLRDAFSNKYMVAVYRDSTVLHTT